MPELAALFPLLTLFPPLPLVPVDDVPLPLPACEPVAAVDPSPTDATPIPPAAIRLGPVVEQPGPPPTPHRPPSACASTMVPKPVICAADGAGFVCAPAIAA
ncbi:hypothetical protein SAMN06265784_105406 [Paraburkholderia susongensis]|uniref:Uncharacterized protein n=1 Tax=Paraburkholderia susongensis TaxID=1515439 RepID=A0A1X7LBY5_9BURK|nr:hypothetical protein SAMN06265784_105406 [Paraburkholderia susongensis]